jgi:hypothetical protein
MERKTRLNNKFYGLYFKQLLLITSCLSTSFASNAALFDCVSVPNFCIGEGDTVIFKYAGSTSSIGLFGRVEVRGNNLVSFPTDFRAESLNSAGAVTVSDNYDIQIIARPGYQIDELKILERGDYYMKGIGTSVGVNGLFSVYDSNDIFGTPADQILVITGDLTIIDESLHTWTGTASFDLAGADWNGINDITLSLQNNLNATANTLGDIAWIEKKIVGVGLITTPVPVPAAVWLFGSGLLGLAGLARRKQKA